MTTLFPDFMDKASLTRISRGDVGALRASVAALDAKIAIHTSGHVRADATVVRGPSKGARPAAERTSTAPGAPHED